FLLAGIVMVLLVEDRLDRGLRVLTAGARRLAGGDLTHRIEYSGRDEMGELSEALNRMAGAMRVTVEGLQRSDERLRVILESAADGIVLFEPRGGTIMEANRRFGLIAGREQAEIAGRPISELSMSLGPEDLARLARRLDWGEKVEPVRGV